MLHFPLPGASSASPARSGQVAVLLRAGGSRVSREPEAGRGWPCMERWSCWRRQEKAGQGQLTRGWASLLEEGGNREGGAARADQGLFSQLVFAFKFILSMYIFTEVAQGLLLFLHFSK